LLGWANRCQYSSGVKDVRKIRANKKGRGLLQRAKSASVKEVTIPLIKLTAPLWSSVYCYCTSGLRIWTMALRGPATIFGKGLPGTSWPPKQFEKAIEEYKAKQARKKVGNIDDCINDEHEDNDLGPHQQFETVDIATLTRWDSTE
ncbi:unnamed protein product, partial [Owenia fusiformis]